MQMCRDYEATDRLNKKVLLSESKRHTLRRTTFASLPSLGTGVRGGRVSESKPEKDDEYPSARWRWDRARGDVP